MTAGSDKFPAEDVLLLHLSKHKFLLLQGHSSQVLYKGLPAIEIIFLPISQDGQD